jgi:hypothetical protein
MLWHDTARDQLLSEVQKSAQSGYYSTSQRATLISLIKNELNVQYVIVENENVKVK